MFFAALMILAFGPLNWSFPWWMWFITIAIELLGKFLQWIFVKGIEKAGEQIKRANERQGRR